MSLPEEAGFQVPFPDDVPTHLIVQIQVQCVKGQPRLLGGKKPDALDSRNPSMRLKSSIEVC